MKRQIIFSKEFDAAVDGLGGYRAVDRAIDTIVEALARNSFAFHKFENDHMSFRYAITKPIVDLPSLVITFTIGTTGNVTLDHVEANLEY